MTTFALSAVSYADLAFFAVLAICLLGGIFGGLARALKGFFKSVAVILFSLLIVGATLTPICNTSPAQKLSLKIASASNDWGIVFTTPVYIADDGSYYILTTYDGEETKTKLEAACDDKNLLEKSSKAAFAKWLAKRFINEETQGQSLSRAASDMVTSIIVAAICFVLFCLVLALICFVLRRIFKHMHDSESSAARAIDRTFGAIVALALGLLFCLLVLAILHATAKLTPTVDEYLNNSVVCGFFYKHNPIATIFMRIFGK